MKVKIKDYDPWITTAPFEEWWFSKTRKDYNWLTSSIDEEDYRWYDRVVFGIAEAYVRVFASPYCKFIAWIRGFKPCRRVKVKIDPWDSYSADSTLSYIILPVLKELKEKKQGAPFVDFEDVPENLRPEKEPDGMSGEIDEFHFARWDWVLDEMIFAFECIASDDDWEDQFHTGKIDITWEPHEVDENDKPSMYEMKKGPNDTHSFDADGHKKMSERIDNGTKLFGKYYRSLWS